MNIAANELRERTHLEIAMSAAVSAGLAPDEATARRDMERIIEKHSPALKTQWLRQRGGGIKGWLCFLRTYGYEEQFVVQKIKAKGASDKGYHWRPARAQADHYEGAE